MRVVNRVRADEIGRDLIAGVPRRVLETVAREGGSTEAQLVNEVVRRLPRSVDPESISGWVDEALGWLIARGDVEREPRGTYRCVPPYLVEPGGGPDGNVLRLHGNPRAEPELLRILAPFDPRLVRGEVRSYSRPEGADAWPELGSLERTIVLASANTAAAMDVCDSRGYTVLRPSSLAATLPRKDDVVAPAERDLAVLDSPAAGVWEAYDPGSSLQNRWGPAEGWQSRGVRLLRWRPSDDWEGDMSARIYYHGGSGRVAELGPKMAALWQHHLDDLGGNPRSIWRSGRRLWVPGMIPAATQRWLELVAGLRARRPGSWLRLSLDEAAVASVRTELARTLGLTFRAGSPPSEYRRHGAGDRYGRRGR